MCPKCYCSPASVRERDEGHGVNVGMHNADVPQNQHFHPLGSCLLPFRAQLIVVLVCVVSMRVIRGVFALQTLNFWLLGEHGHRLS